MRAFCVSLHDCQYKSDTGYCNYSGVGCAQGLVRSVKFTSAVPFTMEKQVALTDECIERIAEAVVRKMGEEAFQELPTADVPDRKVGKWIDEGTNYSCSECHRGCWVNSDYCPWCGARMSEGEEDEGS